MSLATVVWKMCLKKCVQTAVDVLIISLVRATVPVPAGEN